MHIPYSGSWKTRQGAILLIIHYKCHKYEPQLSALGFTWSHEIFPIRLYKDPKPQSISEEMRSETIFLAHPNPFISLVKDILTGN